MKKIVKIILTVMFLLSAIIAIHDLTPYTVHNFELQTIEVSEQREICPNTMTEIVTNLTEHVRLPSYETVRTECLGFNVTHLSLTTDSPESEFILIRSPYIMGMGHPPLNTTWPYSVGDYFPLYIYMSPNATVPATVYFNMTYTADIFFQRPERVLIHQEFIDILLFDARVTLFVAVILMAVVLSYISRKISYY